MDYSIYKDDDVSSTVKKIQKILNDVGIYLEETFYEYPTKNNHIPGFSKYPDNCKFLPYSSRVSLPNMYTIGSNGKGTTKENSQASAYSEFIERLQNQFIPRDTFQLCSDKFCLAPDEKDYNEDANDFVTKYNYTKIYPFDQPKKINNIPFKKVCIPYFNIRDNKIHYLPRLFFIFNSNGMAAGNTPEEALVQGFSELCERFAHKSVFIDKVLMPNLPKKYYEKYERLKGLIDYTEQLGWDVYIKDASLGLGLPVICTVFENKDKGLFAYRFASQPSLPIAIERTITEFFQGQMFKDCDLKNDIYKIENYSKNGLKHCFFTINSERWFFKNSEKLHNTFFNNSFDYKPSVASFVDENKKYTNKELLKFLVDKIKNVTENDIYVRDVSFLGFPSYHIFIPQFSEIEYFAAERANLYKWLKYSSEYKDASYNINSLISAMLFRLKYVSKDRTIAPLIPDEYLLVLCYIIKNDIKNILKYCEHLKNLTDSDLARDFVAENMNFIDIIYHYYSLKQQKERPALIKNILNNIYNYKDVQEFHSFIKNLNFEYVKNLISDTIEKYTDDNNIKSKEEISMYNKLENIKQKLRQKYIENTPNQMELKKVFDFKNVNI